ncbi:hypothetical protein CF149_10638 [Pseudomonas psychrophila]|nr:hypothetical protein CF149_10638 [Pseudomonas psychrophila]
MIKGSFQKTLQKTASMMNVIEAVDRLIREAAIERQ